MKLYLTPHFMYCYFIGWGKRHRYFINDIQRIIMSIKKLSPDNLSFKSIKDFGYSQAKTSDTSISMARWAIDNLAGFPETITPEAKTELISGYHLRYTEMKPDVIFAVIDNNYVLATPDMLKKNIETIKAGVSYAFSYSSQEFGKLKNENPSKHAMIEKIRKATNTYCSNKYKELERQARALLKPEGSTTRQSLTFVETMTKVFETQDKSCKVKETRGHDTTANQLKFRLARDAFWTTYNK
jgi:hypothetical protein